MKVLCRTYIEESVRDAFESRFGDYGAISFVLENAMRELLDMTEGQPDQEEMVRAAIRVHVLKTKLITRDNNVGT